MKCIQIGTTLPSRCGSYIYIYIYILNEWIAITYTRPLRSSYWKNNDSKNYCKIEITKFFLLAQIESDLKGIINLYLYQIFYFI